MLDVASEICGYTKGHPKDFETWWWNKDEDVVLCRKHKFLRFGSGVGMRKIGRNIVRQKNMLRVVCMAMDQKAQEVVNGVKVSMLVRCKSVQSRIIDIEIMQCAMNQMKIRKNKCLKSLTNIFNDTLFEDKLPEEWMLILLAPIFKGKGDPKGDA